MSDYVHASCCDACACSRYDCETGGYDCSVGSCPEYDAIAELDDAAEYCVAAIAKVASRAARDILADRLADAITETMDECGLDGQADTERIRTGCGLRKVAA